jgi:hypothetical protein
MPTFLTTRKMSPALAARVEASVRGRRPGMRASSGLRLVSLLRLAGIALIVGLTCWLLLQRRRAQQELEQERGDLIERVRRESAGLRPVDRALVSRVEAWLARSAGAYEGDSVSAELRGAAAFAAATRRPMVYIRGPLPGIASSAGVAESAAASFKDAFVLCLLSPPAARTEKALLAKARAAHAGDERMLPAAHIERLHDAVVGFPIFEPAWEERVAAAETQSELKQLQAILRRAPLEAAKRAARAELLLFVLDEPGDGSGPTELDGERPHHVRVGLLELATERLLLRLRRHVDPGWISAALRAEYAMGMDGCSLALDVRSASIGLVAGG